MQWAFDYKKCGTDRSELLLLVGTLNKEPLWGDVEQLELIARQLPVAKALLFWVDITIWPAPGSEDTWLRC
jgi:hypothetical protein